MLLQHSKNISTEVQFEEVGTVLTVGDGVARIYGLSKVTENELIEFDNGVMAVAMNLEEDNVGAVILGSSEGIKEGDRRETHRSCRLHHGQREHARPCHQPAGKSS